MLYKLTTAVQFTRPRESKPHFSTIRTHWRGIVLPALPCLLRMICKISWPRPARGPFPLRPGTGFTHLRHRWPGIGPRKCTLASGPGWPALRHLQFPWGHDCHDAGPTAGNAKGISLACSFVLCLDLRPVLKKERLLSTEQTDTGGRAKRKAKRSPRPAGAVHPGA